MPQAETHFVRRAKLADELSRSSYHSIIKHDLDSAGLSTWGFLGGQKFKSLEKMSNGWSDWYQLWFTSADSSGNVHRLNTSRHSIPQGAFQGGV